MNWDIVSAIAEVTGTLAVVGSLIFVGRQFKLQSEQALQQLFIQSAERMGANSENAALVMKGFSDHQSMTVAEKFQYVALINDLYSSLSTIWEQSQAKLVSARTYKRFILVGAFHLTSPGVQAFLKGELIPMQTTGNYMEDMERRGFPKEMFAELEQVAEREFNVK